MYIGAGEMGVMVPVPGTVQAVPQPGMGILAMMTSIGAVPPPLPLQALPYATPPSGIQSPTEY